MAFKTRTLRCPLTLALQVARVWLGDLAGLLLPFELIQVLRLSSSHQVIVPGTEEKHCEPMTERAHVVQEIGIAPEP